MRGMQRPPGLHSGCCLSFVLRWGGGGLLLSVILEGSGQDAWAAPPLVSAPLSPGAGEGYGGLGFSMTVLLCL